MTDNVFLGAMTAGALVVTVLVACYTLLWQGIKDWETGLVLTVLSIGVLSLMDPLVLNWLPLLVPIETTATKEICTQLAAWRKALEIGVYSIPLFAGFCTIRIAEWDWKLGQWLYRLLLLIRRVEETQTQEKMASFTRSKVIQGIVRISYIIIALRILERVVNSVNPVVC